MPKYADANASMCMNKMCGCLSLLQKIWQHFDSASALVKIWEMVAELRSSRSTPILSYPEYKDLISVGNIDTCVNTPGLSSNSNSTACIQLI